MKDQFELKLILKNEYEPKLRYFVTMCTAFYVYVAVSLLYN